MGYVTGGGGGVGGGGLGGGLGGGGEGGGGEGGGGVGGGGDGGGLRGQRRSAGAVSCCGAGGRSVPVLQLWQPCPLLGLRAGWGSELAGAPGSL
jgi:hypothetical protein